MFDVYPGADGAYCVCPVLPDGGHGDPIEDGCFASEGAAKAKAAELNRPATESVDLTVGTTATRYLSENIDLSEATVAADERVIRNVRLIKAGMSLNRRHYPADVLRQAAPIFEGAKAYVGHADPRQPRDRFRDLSGWYSNVRFEGDSLLADRHFTRTDAGNTAWAIAQDIADGRAPASLAGLSINAVGTGTNRKRDDGEVLEVESITSATSVDDVDAPAASGGYRLTASGLDPMIEGILKAVTFDEWTGAQPTFVERLQKQWKSVRLEEATRTALAEADTRVKAANAAASEANRALSEAQSDISRLTSEGEAVLTQLQDTTLRLALERTLAASQLPAAYKSDLRERLPKLAESEWAGVIDTELSKAKRSGDYPPRVSVSGAGQQESKPVEQTFSEDMLLPRPGEDARQWQERTAQYRNMRN